MHGSVLPYIGNYAYHRRGPPMTSTFVLMRISILYVGHVNNFMTSTVFDYNLTVYDVALSLTWLVPAVWYPYIWPNPSPF